MCNVAHVISVSSVSRVRKHRSEIQMSCLLTRCLSIRSAQVNLDILRTGINVGQSKEVGNAYFIINNRHVNHSLEQYTNAI